jgi:sensor histidine kinase YesM
MELLSGIGLEEQVFFGLLLLFCAEQITYWFTGSFPYRHGFLIKTILIPSIAISDWAALRQTHGRLSINIDNRNKEVYLRYKYPFVIFGPLLFMGQIIYNKSGIMKIRVGHFSAIFLLYILLYPLLSGDGYQWLNSLFILAIIGWLYMRFQNSYKGVINTGNNSF